MAEPHTLRHRHGGEDIHGPPEEALAADDAEDVKKAQSAAADDEYAYHRSYEDDPLGYKGEALWGDDLTPAWDKYIDGVVMVALFVAGLFTRFSGLSHPSEVVFDEVHFGGFTNNYLTRRYFFDIHPPFGKLMLALAGYLTGYNAELNFKNIGDPYDLDNLCSVPATFLPLWQVPCFWVLRFTPALTGSLLVPVTYLAARQIVSSRVTAVLGASMVLFDLSLLTVNRMILTDSWMFLGHGVALWLSFRTWRQRPLSCSWYAYLYLSAVFLGMTTSVKWTGLSVVGAVGLRHLIYVFELSSKLRWHKVLQAFLSYALVGAIIVGFYLTCWYLHFEVGNHTGPNDDWHDEPFLATLVGTEAYEKYHGPTPGFLERTRIVHEKMLWANAGIDTPHPWGTRWYTWPLLEKGLNCWLKHPDGHNDTLQLVYMMGNPLVWWLGLLGPLGWLIVTMRLLLRGGSLAARDRTYVFTGLFLWIGWLANFMPYALITRVCFIYHYIPSFLYLTLLFPLTIDFLIRKWSKLNVIVCALCCVAFAAAFFYWNPWTYATTITAVRNDEMKWRPTWV
eukprot:TRINITY_DN38486_c0_g1_i1.p1 TRINITY_DN38486_c0_g1~~TRINITY_DN38486_c0_g1_i1.p1  ORF type:complete len:572 (-),score=118.33 TRINITY_DN38486_c0_g1_i1:47-1735(-)